MELSGGVHRLIYKMTCLISGTKLDSVIRCYQELKFQILQKHVGGSIYKNIRKNFKEKNINKIKKISICWN